MIQYAGGTRINHTFTDAGTKDDLVNKLEADLVTAGWTVISGSAPTDVVLESAATPTVGCKIRLRLRNSGTNCALFNIQDGSGGASQDHYLLPGSVQWRILANQFSFSFFRTGAGARTTARATLFGGTLYVPAWVATQIGGSFPYLGYLGCGATSDTDTTVRNTWRNLAGIVSSIRGSSILLGNVNDYSNITSSAMPHVHSRDATNSGNASRVPYGWLGGPDNTSEPIMSFSPNNTNSTRNAYVGQLFDCIILSGQATGESTIIYDGHTWLAITDLCDTGMMEYTLYQYIP